MVSVVERRLEQLEADLKKQRRLIQRLQGDQYANADRVQRRRFERGSPANNDGYYFNSATGWFELKPAATAASGPHVLAGISGLGAGHTVSGLTARQVLIAVSEDGALFRAIQDGDLPVTIARASELYTDAGVIAVVPFIEYIPFGSEPITSQSYAP